MGAHTLADRCALSGALAAASAVLLVACSSVEFVDRSGMPRVIGLGWIRQFADGDARVYRVSAPGVALRLYPEACGLSVGFRRTLLFFPSPAGDPGLVAVEHESYGVDLTPQSVLLGWGRELMIPSALAGNVLQEIHYSERDPAHTVVHRREAR